MSKDEPPTDDDVRGMAELLSKTMTEKFGAERITRAVSADPELWLYVARTAYLTGRRFNDKNAD